MSLLTFYKEDTPIHKLNPLTKMFMLAVLWTVAFVSANMNVMLATLIFSIVIWRIARIPLSQLKVLFGVVAIVGVMMIVIQGFFWIAEEGTPILFQLFGRGFYLQGALFGLTLAVKIMAVAAAIPILVMTTPVSPFMAALAALKLPYKFVFVFGTAMRLTPLVQEVYDEIREAQRLRGHNIAKMNFWHKITKGYGPIFIPLLLSLLRKTNDMDIAIESRAFGAPVKRSYLDDVRLQRRDYLAILIVLAFGVGLMWLSSYMGWGAGVTGWGAPGGGA
jgi:energy-coupling factor transport system permease protein